MKKLIGLTVGAAMFLSLVAPALAVCYPWMPFCLSETNTAVVGVEQKVVATTGGNSMDRSSNAALFSSANTSGNSTGDRITTGRADALGVVGVAANNDLSCGCFSCPCLFETNTAVVGVSQTVGAETGFNSMDRSSNAALWSSANTSGNSNGNVISTGPATAEGWAIVLTNNNVSLWGTP